MPDLTPEQIREYAETVLLDGVRDVGLMDIYDLAEAHLPDGEISDEDAKTVRELITKAAITISWPEVAG